VCEVRGDEFRMYTLDPVKYGFALCSPSDLVGGTPSQNAAIARAIVNGQAGPKTDAVVMNSAAALCLARDDLSLADGVELARETIRSGEAAAQLDAFIRLTNG
jgi:anthranilate phosphoribosyltransferase